MKQRLLLGGYTRHGGAGIYTGTFDDTQGQLTAPQPYITDLGSPTYLAVSDDHILYAVDAEGDQGGVASYDLNVNPPKLINRVLQPGSSPAHISMKIVNLDTRAIIMKGASTSIRSTVIIA